MGSYSPNSFSDLPDLRTYKKLTPQQTLVMALLVLVLFISIMGNIAFFAMWYDDGFKARSLLPRVTEDRDELVSTLDHEQEANRQLEQEANDMRGRILRLKARLHEATMQQTEQEIQNAERSVPTLIVDESNLLKRMNSFRLFVSINNAARNAGVRRSVVVSKASETGQISDLRFNDNAEFILKISIEFHEGPDEHPGSLYVRLEVNEKLKTTEGKFLVWANTFTISLHAFSTKLGVAPKSIEITEKIIKRFSEQLKKAAVDMDQG